MNTDERMDLPAEDGIGEEKIPSEEINTAEEPDIGNINEKNEATPAGAYTEQKSSYQEAPYQSSSYQSNPNQGNPNQGSPYQGSPYQSNSNQSNPYQGNSNQSNPYQGNPNQGNPYQNNPYQNNPYRNNPYQNNPYRNNPYQNNPNQTPWNGYYGSPYRPPVKKPSLIKRATDFFTQKKYIELSVAATAAGIALILQRLLDFLFGTVIGLVPALNRLYFGNYLFQDVVGMVYSLSCVGLPFVGAYIFLRKASKTEIPFGAPRKRSGIVFLIPAGLGFCYVGNLITNYIVTFLSSVGIGLHSYDTVLSMNSELPKNVFEFLIMAVGTAVIPALVEEFAFRGVIMQSLRRYGDWFAIIISAVIFGLIHGNMMQMPFAIIAGIALGYIAVVTDSIWVSVILHFMNNFLSLIYSFINEAMSDGRSMVFSALYTYGVIFIGVVALAGYAYSNPRFMRLYPSEIKDTKPLKCAGVYFVMPAMIIPVIMILTAIIQDIKI